MKQISYRRHRFPGSIIQHAVWLYFRFPLSYRDVEDMLTERGIDVSYETVRRWSVKFGLDYARKLRRLRPRIDFQNSTIGLSATTCVGYVGVIITTPTVV
jgi:putative transposase